MHDRPSKSNVDTLLNQNRLLAEEIQRRVDQLAAINTVVATVSQSLDLDLTLQTALDAVLSVINVEAAGISLIDEEMGCLVLRAQRGWHHDFVSHPMSIKLNEGLSGQVVKQDTIIITGDPADDERLAVPAFSEEQVQAQALAPMHARGRVIGILSVMSHKPYTFSDAEIDVLKAIADQVGIALDNAQLYEETLHQKKHLFAIINSTADAIIATDKKGRIDLFNHAARQIFDMDTESVIGMSLLEMPLHFRLREGLRLALQNEKDTSTLFEVTLDNGQMLAVVVSRIQAPSQIDKDSEGGWVVVLRDISHLKHAEETRVEFIRGAAHDLRNPLGVALSAVTMLEDTANESDPFSEEMVQIALSSLQRMDDLIDDLLRLEHIESGLNFDPELVDPRPLLVGVLKDMMPMLQRKEQTGELDLADELPLLNLDPNWFQRALINYLSNASKYTQEKGHIIVYADVRDDKVYIEVRDNGPGIVTEGQGRLFEKFYRVPSVMMGSNVPQGTGLGLAIVKSVIQAHGGRVYAHSTPGQGSAFGMVIPVHAPSTEDES